MISCNKCRYEQIGAGRINSILGESRLVTEPVSKRITQNVAYWIKKVLRILGQIKPPRQSFHPRPQIRLRRTTAIIIAQLK